MLDKHTQSWGIVGSIETVISTLLRMKQSFHQFLPRFSFLWPLGSILIIYLFEFNDLSRLKVEYNCENACALSIEQYSQIFTSSPCFFSISILLAYQSLVSHSIHALLRTCQDFRQHSNDLDDKPSVTKDHHIFVYFQFISTPVD